MPVKKVKKKGIKKKTKLVNPEKPLEEKHPSDFDVYKLGQILGKGAFGAVYQGLDTNTGLLVAIKTIPLNNKSSISEVQSEIQMMSKLKNEYIIKYIKSYESKDFLYIVMEYAEGGSLQHVQKKFQNFNEELASFYIKQVLLGLQYLHSQSIIHRDIKAANILLNNSIAKLSDFGISVDLTKQKSSDADFQCSPYWAAPEVINMEEVSDKADVWSLGITAIEMFTGQPPYYELAPIPAMFKIVQNQETPLPENISHEFKDFLLGCLNRNVTFRKTTNELLNHVWITRKFHKEVQPKVNNEVQGQDKHTVADSVLDEFVESDEDDEMNFDDSVIPKGPTLTQPSLNAGGNVGNLNIDDDTDDEMNFEQQIEPSSHNKLDDFVEDDKELADFGDSIDDDSDDGFVDVPIHLSLQVQTQCLNPNNLDNLFEGEEEDPKTREQERQNDLMKSVIAMMDQLPGLIDYDVDNEIDNDNDNDNGNENDNDDDDDDNDDDDNANANLSFKSSSNLNSAQNQKLAEANQKSIIDICSRLAKYFKEEESLRNNLTEYQGIIPIVEIIQTQNLFLLEHALPFILTASNDQTDTQNMLCVLGVLPYLFDYCIDQKYTVVQSIQEMSLQLLHNICTTKKKPLQMFISAGGLTKMAKILDSYTYKERPKITKLIIEMVDAIFSFKCSTPNSSFARIMAQSDFIELLGKRFVHISKDDLLMKKLCEIFEVFSNADVQVKLRMAEKEFIDNIFIKARYKSNVGSSSSPVSSPNSKSKPSTNPNDTLEIDFGDDDDDDDDFFNDLKPKAESGQQTLEEVTASTSDLNDFDLFTIMRVFNNLAMCNDLALKDKLWKSNLVYRLLEYLHVDKNYRMNPMRNTCFSAVFHLSLVLSAENVPRIVPIIPMLIFIINNNLQLKEIAITLFLNFALNYTKNEEMRKGLEENSGTEVLFKLLKENPQTKSVINAFNDWATYSPKLIEQTFLNHIEEFTEIIISVLSSKPVNMQSSFYEQLIQIFDKCPLLAEKLGETEIVSCIVSKLSSDQLDEYPDIRKCFIMMVLKFYQTAKDPKKLIVQHRIDRIGKKLINDPSDLVKGLAEQLMQSVSSNYVL